MNERSFQEATYGQVVALFGECPTPQPVYHVVDIHTQRVVFTFKSKQAARNKRDRLDQAYGAVRYVVRSAE